MVHRVKERAGICVVPVRARVERATGVCGGPLVAGQATHLWFRCGLCRACAPAKDAVLRQQKLLCLDQGPRGHQAGARVGVGVEVGQVGVVVRLVPAPRQDVCCSCALLSGGGVRHLRLVALRKVAHSTHASLPVGSTGDPQGPQHSAHLGHQEEQHLIITKMRPGTRKILRRNWLKPQN